MSKDYLAFLDKIMTDGITVKNQNYEIICLLKEISKKMDQCITASKAGSSQRQQPQSRLHSKCSKSR